MYTCLSKEDIERMKDYAIKLIESEDIERAQDILLKIVCFPKYRKLINVYGHC